MQINTIRFNSIRPQFGRHSEVRTLTAAELNALPDILRPVYLELLRFPLKAIPQQQRHVFPHSDQTRLVQRFVQLDAALKTPGLHKPQRHQLQEAQKRIERALLHGVPHYTEKVKEAARTPDPLSTLETTEQKHTSRQRRLNAKKNFGKMRNFLGMARKLKGVLHPTQRILDSLA